MDRYTLMASKCKLLQEEKVLGFKDEVWYRGEIYTIINIVSSYPISLYTIKSENYNEMPVVPPNELIYRPTLKDLIKMLEEKRWMLNWKLEHDHHNTEYPYGATALNKSIGWFAGIVPKEALLKLVAYERWGLTWSDEKETWEE